MAVPDLLPNPFYNRMIACITVGWFAGKVINKVASEVVEWRENKRLVKYLLSSKKPKIDE